MSASPRAAAVVFACIATLGGSALAHSDAPGERWVLPRGAETAVLKWLEPLQDETDVVPGWKLNKIALEEAKLRLCVESARDAQSACALLAPDPPRLLLTCEPALPATVCARLHAVLDGRPLATSPWHQTEKAIAVQDRPPPWWHVSARQRAGVAWVAWLLALLGVLVRLPRPWPWPTPRVAGIAGVALLAFTVRLLWSPRTFLHEGYRIDLHTQFLRDGSSWPYGEGLTSAAVTLQRFTGLNVDALFLLNLSLSVLAVPFFLALAGRLFAWNRGVWAGGVLLALSPLLVRWSACEEPGPLLLLMTSSAAYAGTLWLDDEVHLPALLLSLASCVLTVHARPEWLPFPLLLVLLPWALGQRPRKSLWLLLPAVVVAGYLIAPLWLDRRGSLQHLPNVDAIAALRVVALWDPRLTLPGYALLVLTGLARALDVARRPALWLLAAIGLTTAMGLMFFATAGPYAERMQYVPVAWSALFAGQAVQWLPQRWSTRATTLLTAALAMLQLAICLPEVTRLYTLQTQWQAQQVAAQLLPNHARLIARADGSLDHFPRIAFDRAGKQIELLDLTAIATSNRWPDGENLYVWLGMACWLQPLRDAPDLATPRETCDAVRHHLTLEPVREWHLTDQATPPHPHLPMPPGGYLIGLYRVQAPPPSGISP